MENIPELIEASIMAQEEAGKSKNYIIGSLQALLYFALNGDREPVIRKLKSKK